MDLIWDKNGFMANYSDYDTQTLGLKRQAPSGLEAPDGYVHMVLPVGVSVGLTIMPCWLVS